MRRTFTSQVIYKHSWYFLGVSSRTFYSYRVLMRLARVYCNCYSAFPYDFSFWIFRNSETELGEFNIHTSYVLYQLFYEL